MGRWTLPAEPPGAAFTARVGIERWQMARATLADLRAFEPPPPPILGRVPGACSTGSTAT